MVIWLIWLYVLVLLIWVWLRVARVSVTKFWFGDFLGCDWCLLVRSVLLRGGCLVFVDFVVVGFAVD